MRPLKWVRITLLPVLMGCCLVSHLGCTTLSPPPILSSEPFVRAPMEEGEVERGRVGASAGYVLSRGVFSTVGEGRAVFRFGQRYDLVVGGRAHVGTIEGHLRILQGPLQVGWTHGFGGIGDFNISAFYFNHGSIHGSTGLTFQVDRDSGRQLFGAVRGAYAKGFGNIVDRGYLIASLGYRGDLISTLSFAPELILGIDIPATFFFVVPGVTVSAGF